MNYLKELYMYNKKTFIIGLTILLSFLFTLIYFTTNLNNDSNNPNEITNYNLVLFGLEEMTLYKDDEYKEPGYYAVLNNIVITSQVEVESNLDVSKLGKYKIIYRIGNIEKIRIVNVIENPEANIKFSLKGDSKIELKIGDMYEELGVIAYDSKSNDISNEVIISGNVDTSIPGIYYINYTININNKTYTLTREIEVIEEIKINLDYETSYTNKDIVVNVNITGSNFDYLKFPDGSVSNLKNTIYNISQNGMYYFYVFDKNGNSQVKSIEISNIDKEEPNATCNAKIYFNRTEISILANDSSGIDYYIYNNEYTSKNNRYTISKSLDNVNVSVYDKAGNIKNISCEMENNYMEIHFIAGVSDDDAILIRTNDKTIMIDGGRWEARNKVVSYLQKAGVKKIDAMIGSHVHWNHVQAQAEIIEKFDVENVYYSVDILNCVSKKHCKSDDVKYIKNKLKEKNITPKILSVKDKLVIGDMELYVIGPVRGQFTTFQNANSLVFILKYKDKKILFTGDTPSSYMNTTKFQNNANYFGMNLDIDVLKWPHHGYENLSDAFFKATTPEYAIIPNCCWCSNKYPSSTNKNLMTKYKTKYYQVCNSKNIVLITDGLEIEVKTKQNPEDYKK